jgi:hypothetical protein
VDRLRRIGVGCRFGRHGGHIFPGCASIVVVTLRKLTVRFPGVNGEYHDGIWRRGHACGSGQYEFTMWLLALLGRPLQP